MAKTEINSWAGLFAINDAKDGDYVLTADLDADSAGYATYNDGVGWTCCIRNEPFTGTFDGQGHTISDLKINTAATRRGLFAHARLAVIENLTLANVDIVNASDYVGAFIGESNGCRLTNCHASGSVSGTVRVGGVIGSASRQVVGEETTITICTNCTASVSVNGSDTSVGGFVGQSAQWSEFHYCSASGNVTSSSSRVGGFVGFMDDLGYVVCRNCFATGNVTGSSRTGGFVGYLRTGTATNCYASGNVHTTHETNGEVGGFVGYQFNATLVDKCYSSGTVTQDSDPPSAFIGGFAGRLSSTSATNSFYDSTKNAMGSATGTGKSTAEMQTLATFTNEATVGLTEAWDFVGSPNDDEGTDDFWDIDDSYPFLTDYPTEDAFYKPFESIAFHSNRFRSALIG